MTALLSLTVLGNPLADWLMAAAAVAFSLLVLPFFKRQLRRHHAHWRREHAESEGLSLLAQLLDHTHYLLLLVIALYWAEQILILPEALSRVHNVLIIVGAWVQGAIWASVALRFVILRRYGSSEEPDPSRQASVNILLFCARLLAWGLFALLAMDNLGINITALVAGLGVGGIAVALAVQTLLGDLFGSLSIAFDKPFVVGDWLQVDQYEGTVERIGIKSTRLRAFSGEQVIIANADLLRSRVRNLGRMPERRVLFRLYIAYDTAPAQVAQVTPLVTAAIQTQTAVRTAGCRLIALGPYALEFEVCYFVADPATNSYADIVDAVNRAIFERFAGAGIRFAYPTQRQVQE
ncbi:MAG: hypothetical protein RL026_1325 [Pseudomonadota bacterium]|jgi:small-conductance mechanosensitive channel